MNKSSTEFARRLLVLIIALSVATFVFVVYFQNPQTQNPKKSLFSSARTLKKQAEAERIKQTSGRVQQYVYFFEKNEQELKALEASASVNLKTDLKLDELYLNELLGR